MNYDDDYDENEIEESELAEYFAGRPRNRNMSYMPKGKKTYMRETTRDVLEDLLADYDDEMNYDPFWKYQSSKNSSGNNLLPRTLQNNNRKDCSLSEVWKTFNELNYMSNIDHKVTGIPVIDKIYDKDFMHKISRWIPNKKIRALLNIVPSSVDYGAYAARGVATYKKNF